MKPTTKLKSAGIAAALLLSPLSAAVAQEMDEDVFARVNGKEIKLGAINSMVGQGNVSPQQIMQMVDQVVNSAILAQQAEELGLDESEAAQNELELLRMQVLARAYVQDFLAKQEIGEDSIGARYEELKGSAPTGNEYLSSHILVATEDEALEAIEEIGGDPEAFARVATERSTDPGSAANGGSLGWAPAQTFVPEFAEALEALEPGEITSEPVESQFGWHIIYAQDSRAIEFPPLDEGRRQQILEQLRGELVAAEVDRLVAEADIEINPALGGEAGN